MENELHKNSGVKAFVKSVKYADQLKYEKNLIGWLGPLPKELRETIEPIINTGITRDELIKILKDMKIDSEDSVQSTETEQTVVPNKFEKEYQPYNKKTNPTEFRVGDVLMHPVFKHPYVLLEDKGEYWACALLTTDPTCSEVLEICQSRFFPESHFTRVVLTVKKPYGSFIYPYDNTEHLEEVKNKLKQIL
jgi:hypothetical protein